MLSALINGLIADVSCVVDDSDHYFLIHAHLKKSSLTTVGAMVISS